MKSKSYIRKGMVTTCSTLQDPLLKLNYLKKLKKLKNNRIFHNKIFADPWFESEKMEFNNINIDELLYIQHNQLSLGVERLK